MNSLKKAEKSTLAGAKAIERNLPIPLHVDNASNTAMSIRSASETVKQHLQQLISTESAATCGPPTTVGDPSELPINGPQVIPPSVPSISKRESVRAKNAGKTSSAKQTKNNPVVQSSPEVDTQTPAAPATAKPVAVTEGRNDRKPPSPVVPSIEDLQVGDVVEARYMSGLEWFRGKVTGVNSSGGGPGMATYSLRYDDGDEETDALRRKIRRKGDSQIYGTSETLPIGLGVDANCSLVVKAKLLPEYANCLPGEIVGGPDKVPGGGGESYEVQFDLASLGLQLPEQVTKTLVDGKSREWVTRDKMFAVHGLSLARTAVVQVADKAAVAHAMTTVPADTPIQMAEVSMTATLDDFKVGDVVEARYMSGLEWFGAKVTSVNSDGGGTGVTTYCLRYDDGDEEAEALRRKIRRKGDEQVYGNGIPLPIGLAVDACCSLVVKAKLLPEYANCLPGEIIAGPAATAGGGVESYEIRFNLASLDLQLPSKLAKELVDGTAREWVTRDKIFTVHGPMAMASKVGPPADRVGLVSDVKKVDPKKPVLSPDEPLIAALGVFKVGDVVEARYMSGLEWFGAKIIGVNNDAAGPGVATYSLRYDDGDEEADALRRKIRRKGDVQIYDKGVSLPVGLGVDACCSLVVKAKLLPEYANCLPGEIVGGPEKASGGGDERYEIQFDLASLGLQLPVKFTKELVDGKAREWVTRDQIFVVHGHPKGFAPARSSEVAPVDEAVLRPDMKKAELTVHAVAEPAGAALADIKVGDVVEARYMSGLEWFGAKITSVNDDAAAPGVATYSLRYDDGDEEADALRRKIRRKGDRQIFGPEVFLPVGLGVDACCSLVVRAKLLPEYANCLPGEIVGGPDKSSRGGDESYEIQFDLASLDLQLPGKFAKELVDGKVREWVSRDKIFVVHGPAKDEVAEASTLAVAPVDDAVLVPNLKNAEQKEPDAEPTVHAVADIKVGDVVEARYMSGLEWFGAKVTGINNNAVMGMATYSLRYDDGDEEADALRRKIRRKGDEPIYGKGVSLPVGLAVDACCSLVVKAKLLPEYANCLPGEIVSGPKAVAGAEESYEIQFDLASLDLQLPGKFVKELVDGKTLEWVPRDKISVVHGTLTVSSSVVPTADEAVLATEVKKGETPSAATAEEPLGAALGDFKVGDVVEARYMSGLEWFAAKITSVNSSSGGAITYGLRYDDGDEEADALARKIRHKGDEPIYGRGVPLPLGLGVDASCLLVVKAKLLPEYANCLPGEIVGGADKAVGGGDESYEIQFDLASLGLQLPGKFTKDLVDGQAREWVTRDKIFVAHGPSMKNTTPVITTVVPPTDEAVLVSDATKTELTKPDPVTEEPMLAALDEFRVGDKVEARYMSGLEWFGAKVTSVNRSGGGPGVTTYGLRYDDGDEEADALRRKIRRKGDEQIYGKGMLLPVGLAVDACCSLVVKAKLLPEYANCLPGEVIDGPNRIDGSSEESYEILFDLASLGLQLPDKFTKGLVDGKSREWVTRDKIFVVHGPSTTDSTLASISNVAVADEAVLAVDAKKPEPDAAPPAAEPLVAIIDDFNVGDVVEARYMSGLEWFGAKITSINSNGAGPGVATYSLRYDDGDEEADALRRKIRRKGDVQIYDKGVSLPVGLGVDACCSLVVKAKLLPEYANCLPGEIVGGPEKASGGGDERYEIQFDLASLGLQLPVKFTKELVDGKAREWVARDNIFCVCGRM
jgi:hypothetical protein